MRSWIVFLAIAVGPCAILGHAEPSRDSDAFLERLAAVRRDRRAVEVGFREERRLALVDKPIVTEGTMVFQQPAMFRRETTGTNASTAVCDGQTFWLYYPRFNEVESYSVVSKPFIRDVLAAATASLDLTQLNSQFRHKVTSAGNFTLLELVPRRSSLSRYIARLRIWIRPDFSAAKAEMTAPNGDVTTTVFKWERAITPDTGRFKFQPPPGAKVVKPFGE